MKIRLVHVGLIFAVLLMFAIWMSAKLRTAGVERTLAASTPQTTAAPLDGATLAASELQYVQQSVRTFLRDAPNMSPEIRMERAQILAKEVSRREQAGEVVADQAMMIQIGLIQAAVVEPRERVRQTEQLLAAYRKRGDDRNAAAKLREQQDARLRQYRAREAQIVAEVGAMAVYPGGMSREAYLRVRLEEARAAIYGPAGTRTAIPLVEKTTSR